MQAHNSECTVRDATWKPRKGEGIISRMIPSPLEIAVAAAAADAMGFFSVSFLENDEREVLVNTTAVLNVVGQDFYLIRRNVCRVFSGGED